MAGEAVAKVRSVHKGKVGERTKVHEVVVAAGTVAVPVEHKVATAVLSRFGKEGKRVAGCS